MTALIAAVRKHAIAHYEQGGWDYIVECWSDFEIAETITEAGATTEEAAIKAVGEVAGLLAERRADVQATADW